MADLPRPKIEVNSKEDLTGHTVDVVISRDNKAKSYSGGGAGVSRNDATRDVVEKILNDPHSAEWIPKG